MNELPRDKRVGAALVYGAGIGGMQAALDLANSGIKVYLVDKDISIGGNMARLDRTFPTNDCATCIIAPKLIETGRHQNIEIITGARIESVEGEAGHFKVRLHQAPRYVKEDLCNGCGDCAEACPVEVPSDFNQGLATRKAIHRHTPQAIPNAFAIDKQGTSPCKGACPIRTSAQGYIALIAEGRFQEALEVSRRVNPFTSVCGRICYHPCEEACSRNRVDEPVSIAALKRFISDYAAKHGEGPVEPAEVTREERVAIVGSGPCGLTAAQDLALLGYPVTVFEALPEPGGMLRYGIPDYRLPKDVLAQEIGHIADLGVEIITNHPVYDVGGLLGEYDAVFVAIGAHKDIRMGIEGEDLEGAYSAIDFLRRINMGQEVEVGRRAYVIGGGNTAIDAARSCLRLGAQVTILYRRSRAEMPAHPFEVAAAEEEGVKIEFLAAPFRVMGRDGKLAALECIKMELGAPDETGRRRPIPIPGSEFTLEADSVIFAIGQAPDLSLLPSDVEVARGRIAVDPETMATSREGLFAGGDAVTGPRNAVEAIAAGHRAAEAIHRYLSGEEVELLPRVDEEKIVELNEEEIEERLSYWGVERGGRVRIPTLPLEVRLRGFEEVELGLSEEEAVAEAERCLSCAICSECLQCVEACGLNAIDHSMAPKFIDLDVGAIILAPGFNLFEAQAMGEYGYGIYPNVITSLEFERILSASGPTEGRIQRPSDGAEPRRIAFIQCVGSRNLTQGNNYCSAICCMYATKEAIVAKEHVEGIETTIFYIDLRTFGKGFYRYYERAKNECGVRYIRSMVSSIKEIQQTKNLLLKYVDEDGNIKEEEFDLVVLSVGLKPSAEIAEICERLSIRLNKYGFCETKAFSPVETSREGIYACGTVTGPKDIPETVMEASAAASCAGQLLSSERGTLVEEREFPEERDVSGEEPRIGAFICDCGINIAGVVDVPEVVEFARSLPGVVIAEESPHTCAPDVQALIKEKIKELNLNRIFVASCSPRTHELLFQQTLQEAGLNKYLFEMANIRDQCSWVHMHEPEKATEKAKDLVRMGLNRALYLTPLYSTKVELNHSALVIGGGLSGMTAALSLSGQGFEVYLVEKESELGGNLRHLYYTLEGNSVQDYLTDLIERVRRDPLIHIYTGARIKGVEGYIGNFATTIATPSQEETLKHGVIIVATGAEEYKPREYLYGEDPRVVTQREFEEMLASGEGRIENLVSPLSSVVMIQCVGSRNGERPYCSRICCSQALKNALKVKEIKPDVDVFILYRDITSYGFKEEYYTKAREANVKFIRYDLERPPEVKRGDFGLSVSVWDANLRRTLNIDTDLLVLSVATVAPKENEDLAPMLKVPLDGDGFFLEAHMKLRPVDFATDGVFVCGLAHSPKFMEESIVQARAVAGRAATVLSKAQIESEAMVPVIDLDKCIGCGVCELTCPFQAIKVGETEKGKKAQVILAACKGCGSCGAACPQMANIPGHFTDRQLMAQIEAFAEAPRISVDGFEPKILGFLCNWCAYAGADLAGVSRIQYQPNFHTIRVMCTGRIDPALVIEAFLRGIDGVMVLGCHPGDCHYSEGNLRAQERMSYLRHVLERMGLDPRRLHLDWVSASEGGRFSEIVNAFTDEVRALGPIFEEARP